MSSASTPAERLHIPTRFDDVTPGFLTDALREAGALHAGRVVSCSFDRIRDGVAFAGDVARFYLEYSEAADDHGESPRSLIAKLPSDNPANRWAVDILGGYEREVCFYNELAAKCKLPIPRCYLATMDPDPSYDGRRTAVRRLERIPVTLFRMLLPLARFIVPAGRRYLVLLEDLSPARNLDQAVGCGPDEAERAVRALAAFHAGNWNDQALEEMIWLVPVDTLPRLSMALHRSARRGFYRRFADSVPPVIRAVCNWVDEHFKEIMDLLARPPYTALHGDYRLDNLFIDDERIWACDFQGVVRGRGGMDLGNFLCFSADLDIDEGPLIDAYCDELRAWGVDSYARDECLRDVALSKLAYTYLHIASTRFIDFGDGRGADLWARMRERMFGRVPEPPYDHLLVRTAP